MRNAESPFHWVPRGLSAGASSWSLTPSIDKVNMLSYISAPPSFLQGLTMVNVISVHLSDIKSNYVTDSQTSLLIIDNFKIQFHVYRQRS